MIRTNLILALTGLAFVGCDRPEPTTYTIPKEDRSVEVPSPITPQPDPSKSSNMQVLPGMAEAAAEAPEFTYIVPESWEEFPPQSIRKANFRVSNATGSAEITVTTFPGDVGGMLGNVNRWLGQIEMDPVDAAGLERVSKPFVISFHAGTFVTLEGPSQSILAGILDFHGDTWFFKMQGAKGTVATHSGPMEAFLRSVRIEDNHH